LALFALAVGVSLAMRFNEAYVLLVVPPYRAEISLNLVVLLVVIGFGAFYVLLRAVALASSLPRRVRESRARREHEKVAETFAKGVRLYLAGERRKAIDTMASLRGEGDWPTLAASLAARAASELDAVDEQREWQAHATEPDPQMALPAVPEVPEENSPAAAEEETSVAKN
jgi:HemY protein